MSARDTAVAQMRRFVSARTPYVFGGGRPISMARGIDGTDCSGSVIAAWEAASPGCTGGAGSTATMRRRFTATGKWRWHKRGDGYIIVAGERRYRAAKAVGMATVPALVKRIDDSLMREISLIENLQREDLNPIEEAEAIDELIRLNGYTQEKLAQRIGKARSSVTNILRLLGLDDEVKELVRQNRLSAGHARALAAVANREAQVDFAFRAADGEMSVRELEQRIKFFLHPETAPRKLSPKERERLSGEMRAFVDDMKRVFATKVKLVGNESKGRIYIDYFSRDDLERIYELIEKLKNI